MWREGLQAKRFTEDDSRGLWEQKTSDSRADAEPLQDKVKYTFIGVAHREQQGQLRCKTLSVNLDPKVSVFALHP